MAHEERPLYENSTPWWRVTIRDSATGQPRNITGLTPADFRATIGRRGYPGIAGSASVFDGPGGVVDVIFPQGSATSPSVIAQLDANIGGIWDTVWSEETPVRVSIIPAP